MESSAVVAFRAVVMLSCLILVPLAAVLGSAFPEVVKTQVERAVAWGKTLPLWNQKPAPRHAAPQVAKAGRRTSHQGVQFPDRGNPAGETRRGAAPSATRPALYEAPVPPRGAPAQSGVQPASALEPAPMPSSGQPWHSAPCEATPSGPCDYRSMETELRQNGAVYYLLESWGEQRQQYRFHCRVGSDRYASDAKLFEAIENDPMTAMRKVVDQVRSWRASQR